jgi:glycosyltransferase 2 family protein
VLAKVTKRLLFVLALAFVVQAAVKLSKDWDSSTVHLSVEWLLLSLPFAALACYVQGIAFHRLLQTWTETELSEVRTTELFFASQLARYTPGRLGLLAIRMARAAELGLQKEQLGSVTLGEVLVWFVSGIAALTLALATTDARAFGSYLDISTLGFVGAGALFVAALSMSIIPRRVWFRLLGPKLSARLFSSDTTKSGPLVPVSTTFLLLLHWFLWILHGSLLGLSVGMPMQFFTFPGTAFLLSIFAGFFSFFAPGGVGVREAVLAYCLAPLVGAANATLVGVMARAASLGAEIALYGLARIRLAREK